jgi:hypothetical protein
VDELLNRIYPMRTITITSGDPYFLTPSMKLLLRRKNHFMRTGRVEEVSAIASRVGKQIERITTKHLRNIDPKSGTDELWQRVKETRKSKSCPQMTSELTTEDLNSHYATISNDQHYHKPLLKQTVEGPTYVTEQ